MLMRTDYKKKIDNTEWVNERISEVFDDATEMLTENSIVFGGAVRDALAGQELTGDIDIATNIHEYNDVISRFQKSVKWIPYSKKLQSGVMPGRFMPEYVPNYKKLILKLSNMMSFIHMNGCVAQIIAINSKEVCDTVRNVDIVCCGVMMSYDGQVFELIEGAYEDCVTKVLRLNKTKNIVDMSETPNRIVKLVERGWKSLITSKQLDKIIAKYKKSFADIKLKREQKCATHRSPIGTMRTFDKPHGKFHVYGDRSVTKKFVEPPSINTAVPKQYLMSYGDVGLPNNDRAHITTHSNAEEALPNNETVHTTDSDISNNTVTLNFESNGFATIGNDVGALKIPLLHDGIMNKSNDVFSYKTYSDALNSYKTGLSEPSDPEDHEYIPDPIKPIDVPYETIDILNNKTWLTEAQQQAQITISSNPISNTVHEDSINRITGLIREAGHSIKQYTDKPGFIGSSEISDDERTKNHKRLLSSLNKATKRNRR